jgi:hypothetical protein
MVHDIVVAGPLGGSNMPLAKGLVAERARMDLGNPDHEHFIAKICTCGGATDVDVANIPASDTPALASEPWVKAEQTKGYGIAAKVDDADVMMDEIESNGVHVHDIESKDVKKTNGVRTNGAHTNSVSKDESKPPSDETTEGFASLAKAALCAVSEHSATQEADGKDVDMMHLYDAPPTFE